MNDTENYLPLSYLNQLAYCPRRFWLMFVESELAINAPMQEGIYRHKNAHHPGSSTDWEGRTLRSVMLWSEQLRVIGMADFIEERTDWLIPVEHKRGRMNRWINDHVQLCAQAICLEERTGQIIEHGEIFYWSNRRREQVTLDDALRQRTIVLAQEAFVIVDRGLCPPPIDDPPKCRDCSIKPICLPQETLCLLTEEAQEYR